MKKIKKLHKEHGGDVRKMVDKMNFVSEADVVCMAHDLRYYIQGKSPALVRRADERMLKNLKRLKKEGKESKFNLLPSELGIKAKVKLEDWGIMKKGSFADGKAKEELSEEDYNLASAVLGELGKRGYGFAEDLGLPEGPFTREEVGLIQPVVRAINPQAGNMLDLAVAGDDFVKGRGEEKEKERPKRKPANKWIQHVKRYAMQHDVSYREALKQAGETYKKD